MTYRELKEKLHKLEDSQLDQTVEYQAEDHVGLVDELFVAEDDYINPSGEGAEPIGEYRKYSMEDGGYESVEEMEEDLSNERIVFKKGTVFICGERK